MRVAVAKDVLKLMRLGLNARRGDYCNISDYDAISGEYVDVLSQLRNPESPAALQELIGDMAEHCTVCAKGAIALAHIHLLDGEPALPYYRMEAKAREIWGDKNANLIEEAFETSPGESYWRTLEKKGSPSYRAREFGVRYTADKRLRAIMNNVIRNNGTFKP